VHPNQKSTEGKLVPGVYMGVNENPVPVSIDGENVYDSHGNGIIRDESQTYFFDPALAGIGEHTLNILTTEYACTNRTVTVLAKTPYELMFMSSYQTIRACGEVKSFLSSVTGGVPPYTYQWENVPQIATFTSDSSGTITPSDEYTTATDSYGVSAKKYFLIEAVPEISEDPSMLPTFMETDQDSLLISLGQTDVRYSAQGKGIVSYGDSSYFFPSLATPGVYDLTIYADYGNCRKGISHSIEVRDPFSLKGSALNETSYCTSERQIIRVLPQGGEKPYSYQWSCSLEDVSVASDETSATFTLRDVSDQGTASCTITDANNLSLVKTWQISTKLWFWDVVDAQHFSDTVALNGGLVLLPIIDSTVYYSDAIVKKDGRDYFDPSVAGLGTATIGIAGNGNYFCNPEPWNPMYTEVSIVVAEKAQAMGLNFDPSNTVFICNGAKPEQVTVTPYGGSPYSDGYDYRMGNDLFDVAFSVTYNIYDNTEYIPLYFKDSAGTVIRDTIWIETNQLNAMALSNATITNGEEYVLKPQFDGQCSIAGYQWSTGSTDASITVSEAGKYHLTITETNGCSYTDSAIIETVPACNISIEIQGGTISEALMFQFVPEIDGAQEPISYNWHYGDKTATEATLHSSEAGIYELSIIDANGCKATDTAKLTVIPCSIQVEVADAKISEGENHTFVPQINGAQGDISYAWKGPNFTSDLSQIVVFDAGTYTLSITDSKGCSAKASGTLTAKTVCTAEIALDDAEINEGESHTFKPTISGAHGTVAYNWFTNKTIGTDQTLTVSQAGEYELEVVDEKGCSAKASATLAVKQLPERFSISGTVYENTLKATTCGSVSVYNVSGNGLTFVETVAVDQNGNYSVGQLPASEYTLLAKPCDTANFYPTYFVHSLSADDAISTDLKGDATSVDIDLVEKIATTIERTKKTISIYPNPMKETGIITCDDRSAQNIHLVNALGEVVQRQNVTKSATALVIQGLPTGVYTIVVSSSEKVIQTETLVVE